jgi:hypothetical protein
MKGISRVSASETRQKVRAGQALLVCAYESAARFAKFHLEGAISFNAFKELFPKLEREQEIIFYCN